MIDYLSEMYELLFVAIVLIIMLMTAGCSTSCSSELAGLKAPEGWAWKVKLVKNE
jgi:hypothetical protein